MNKNTVQHLQVHGLYITDLFYWKTNFLIKKQEDCQGKLEMS